MIFPLDERSCSASSSEELSLLCQKIFLFDAAVCGAAIGSGSNCGWLLPTGLDCLVEPGASTFGLASFSNPLLAVSGFRLSNFIDPGNFILSSLNTISLLIPSSVAVAKELKDGGASSDVAECTEVVHFSRWLEGGVGVLGSSSKPFWSISRIYARRTSWWIVSMTNAFSNVDAYLMCV